MAATRRRIKGDRGFRKLLQRLPDTMKAQMGAEIDAFGDELLAAERADVPRRRGRLAQGLSKTMSRTTLRLRVGLIGKPVNRRLFYGLIVELGRRAQTVTVRRLKRGARKTWTGMIRAGTASARFKPVSMVTSYQLRVRAMPPRPFVWRKRNELRERFNKRINSFWNNSLTQAANGASDE